MYYEPTPPASSRRPTRRPSPLRRSSVPLVLGVAGITLGLVLITAVLAYQAGRASVSAATTSQTTAHSPAATAHAPTWTTLQAFSGTTNKKTATFTVPDSWRLVWSCTPAQNSPNNLAILVYQSDNTLLDGALDTICKPGQTGDTTDEHQGGQVYLDVTAFERWAIQIQALE